MPGCRSWGRGCRGLPRCRGWGWGSRGPSIEGDGGRCVGNWSARSYAENSSSRGAARRMRSGSNAAFRLVQGWCLAEPAGRPASRRNWRWRGLCFMCRKGTCMQQARCWRGSYHCFVACCMRLGAGVRNGCNVLSASLPACRQWKRGECSCCRSRSLREWIAGYAVKTGSTIRLCRKERRGRCLDWSWSRSRKACRITGGYFTLDRCEGMMASQITTIGRCCFTFCGQLRHWSCAAGASVSWRFTARFMDCAWFVSSCRDGGGRSRGLAVSRNK